MSAAPVPSALTAAPLSAAGDAARFGAKAARIAALTAAGAPCPPGLALAPGAAVSPALLDALAAAAGKRLGDPADPLLAALRPSAGEGPSGAPSVLGLGLTAAATCGLAHRLGEAAAWDLRTRFIQRFAELALEVDPEALEAPAHGVDRADPVALRGLSAALLAAVRAETGEDFPEDPLAHVALAAAAVRRRWDSPRARLMRQAAGGEAEQPLALVLQAMALGVGPGVSGLGEIDSRDPVDGAPTPQGRWTPQAHEDELGRAHAAALATAPQAAVAAAGALAAAAEAALSDAARVSFVLENGRAWALDATPAPRRGRAAVRIAVDMAEAGRISRADALLRVDPVALVEHLHPTVDPAAARDVLGRGLAASPGAAAGPVAFTPDAAEVFAARGQPAILLRQETGPEDIRGMHVAAGVVTARGGLTSHAAVVARGVGAPCVVGLGEMRLDLKAGLARFGDRVLREGDPITVDGGAGEALAGAAPLVRPEFGGAVATLMVWADAHRRMGVRANADTPAEARMARGHNVDGLGLCRTEHMFLEPERVTAMREMILAETPERRRAALARLLPWQRADFVDLFRIMQGLPVTIRLLDPPLHEFLPQSERDLELVAAAARTSVARVRARAAELAEVNPMLGMRGCRLGVVYPEIYEMQARAIFEAALEAAEADAAPVTPEIMIPLVSTSREIELLKRRVAAVAEAVGAERGAAPAYRVGCMVETPRAALMAEEIARGAEFLSFGTNDMTQMTFGLSRDDAGAFMRAYLAAGVFRDDPFQSLDVEAVGELLLIAAERGRRGRADVALGLCGEHGGDPASVRFCELAGFDYVSCSPFRAPIARLAAAQARILAQHGQGAAVARAAQ